MPKGSRDEIRRRCQRMLDEIDDLERHLKIMYDIAGGRSQWINDAEPVIITMCEELRRLVDSLYLKL